MGAINRETKLDQGLSSALGFLSARLLSQLLEQIAGMKNYPPAFCFFPTPPGQHRGLFTLFTQARNWGMIRELNLGAEALTKSMARGGCLGSSGGRD